MMTRHILKYVILILVVISGKLISQSLTASASSNKIGESDQVEVSFTFSGQDINSATGFKAPDFGGLLVISGPNQSTSMQIINGAVSGELSYSYYLRARGMGKFTVGSASINYKGTTLRSSPITIEVGKGSPKQNASGNTADNTASQNQEIGKNLFIRAFADKQKAYVGEQVTITYKLYTRLSIAAQMQVSKLPQYQGFWCEELETANNINFTVENYEGKQYRVGILKKAALFPSQSGELSVTPMELNVPVQIQKKRKQSGNSIFDDFFNDPFFGNAETVNYDAKSNTIKITAIPLPENKPETFKGAVGQYTITSELDKTTTKANEPLSLKVNIFGSGNISLLSIPDLNLPTGIDKYDPKSSDQITRQGRISGKKAIEYLLVPRNTGKKEIPPVKFSYFDPAKKSYVTISTPPYNINVEQGSSDQNYAGLSKEDIKLLGDDIRYIKTSTSGLHKTGDIVLYNLGFWTASVLPLFFLIGAVMWKRREDKLSGNVQLLRYRKAQRISQKRLKTAKELMNSGKQPEFYGEISLALFGYLEDKLHIPKSEFTLDRASVELKSRNIDENLIGKIITCAEKCEYIRFAPVEDGTTEMNNMYNDTEKLIIDVERSILVKKHA